MVLARPADHAAPTPLRRDRGGVVRLAATAGAAVGALVVLATVDPHEQGNYPTCPMLAATGLYCPGCGSLRALHDLTQGDLVGALARNPMTVAAVVVLVAAWACWALRLAGRDAPHPTRVPARWLYALLVLVVAFGVLRNLPGWTLLSPA